MKKIILLIISILITSIQGCGDKPGPAPSQSAVIRTVITPDGSKAEIPSYPQRIACFYNPAYDKIVMLSRGSRIALIPSDISPWAKKFYPELAEIPVITTGDVPDVERLLKLKIDLVIYPKGKRNVTKVIQAGIPAVCPFNDGFTPSNIDEYTGEFKKQIMFFSNVLGSDTGPRAERYCRYLEEITAKVKAITLNIPESEKPSVYYGKMSDLCSTQGNNTIMQWYTELAGGIYLPRKMEQYFSEVNMEQVIAWNPDIVLLGMMGSFKGTDATDGLNILRAYRNGKVFRVPAGIFCWDMTSCETALLPLFLGKKFHPSRFKNWDIVKEMKDFYSAVYGITITGRDAERILRGLPPL